MKQHRSIRTSALFVVTLVIAMSIAMSFPGKMLAADSSEPTSFQKGLVYNKPGVVFISTYYKMNLVIQSASSYPELAGKTYKAETGMTGSGFVVNPEGYILTNGHVIFMPSDQLAYYALSSVADAILKDVVTVTYVQTYGTTPTKAELDQMVPIVTKELGGSEGLINALYEGYKIGEIKLDKVERNVYVQTGAFVSGKKVPIEQGEKAEVKVVDYEGFTDEGDVKGKDIGIIKVNATAMPTVVLGDSDNVQVGQRISVVGYPGAATFQEFLSKESQLEPTMTSGIISAVKTMTDNSKILQTDAALTHGNSGGPVFTEEGEVIGIASMVAVQEGEQKFGFSYLRPSNIAKDFLRENNIENKQGPTDNAYRKALGLYWDKKYTKAIAEFQKVKNLYPAFVDIDDYITKSEQAKARGEEASDWGWLIWLVLLGGGFVFVIFVIVVVVILMKRKKKAMPAVPAAAPPTPPAPPQQKK